MECLRLLSESYVFVSKFSPGLDVGATSITGSFDRLLEIIIEVHASLQASSEIIEDSMLITLNTSSFPSLKLTNPTLSLPPSSALPSPALSPETPSLKNPYIRPQTQSQESVSLETWIYYLQKELWYFHNRCQKYSLTQKPNSLQLILRRRKLNALGNEMRTAWLNLMLYVGIAQSQKHIQVEKSLRLNLKRLAVATGQIDYMDLNIDNAKVLFMEGDKYLLGFGYFIISN
jgi:hypothetical protein